MAALLSGEGKDGELLTLAVIKPGLAEEMQVFAARVGLHCKLPRVAGDYVVLAMLIWSICGLMTRERLYCSSFPLASSVALSLTSILR